QTLHDMAGVFGERNAAVARELTKMHEEVLRGTLSELAQRAADGLRGEITVVVAGAPSRRPGAEPLEIAARLRDLVGSGTPKKEAIAAIAAELDVPKKVVYQAALDEGL
ncbi:MAG: 16S rRNA (cytidine(1402)-2'-O)-methyltransferase, partial [Actinomycetota bacterium]